MKTKNIIINRNAVKSIGILPAVVLNELINIEQSLKKDKFGWYYFPRDILAENLNINTNAVSKALTKLSVLGFVITKRDKTKLQFMFNSKQIDMFNAGTKTYSLI